MFRRVHRPQDLMPRMVTDGVKRLLSFDVLSVQGATCLFTNMTAVTKTAAQSAFVVYFFAVVLIIYLASGCCCACVRPERRPRIGAMSMNARMLTTVVSLFLYTYQNVAENAFMLLNCTDIGGGRNVLFYDGNVACLQPWQYGVVVCVCVFIVPFFVILLLGPKLLAVGRISVFVFFMAFLLPLFFTVPMSVYFVQEYKKGVSEKPKPGDGEKDDAVVETSDVREAVGEVVTGAYRPDILGGVCWEGAINFRRMILVLIFTFVNDILLKHLALSGGCFVILLFHLRATPFKQRFSNIFESVSLSLLLVISGTNLVKSAFYHSQTIPRGQAYIVMVVFEWIEAVALGILPITLIALLFITLIFKTGRRVLRSEQKNTCSTSLRSIDSREACFRLAGSHSKQHRRHDDTSPGKRRSSQSHHHNVRRRNPGVTSHVNRRSHDVMSHVKRASGHRRSNHKIRSREDTNDEWGRDVSDRSRHEEKRYDDFYSRISFHIPNRNHTGFSGYNMYTPHHAC